MITIVVFVTVITVIVFGAYIASKFGKSGNDSLEAYEARCFLMPSKEFYHDLVNEGYYLGIVTNPDRERIKRKLARKYGVEFDQVDLRVKEVEAITNLSHLK